MKQILIQGNHRKQNLYTTSYLNTSDTGRSMTEMLGTLAIIGVLSIIGITGYRFAMNQYQANSIAHELNLLRNELQIQMANGNEKLFLGIPYDSETVDQDTCNITNHMDFRMIAVTA